MVNRLHGQNVQVLINTGAIDNFIRRDFAKDIKLSLFSMHPYSIYLRDEHRLRGHHICKEVSLIF